MMRKVENQFVMTISLQCPLVSSGGAAPKHYQVL